ncbi:pyridoxal phosphate-dependent aminotransferase [bacterium]|nr:pyridoxal phosphate-dependent aminotransferase [bacterium]
MTLAKRISAISPSPTLAITAKVKEMKAKGIDVIGFGAGEPDFDTPEHIKEEAKRSLDEGFTKYTPDSGIPELKEAICKKLKKDNDLDYEPGQIIVSCGAKHSLYNAMQVLCESGDEVLLPSPYWVSYPEQIRLSGAEPVIIETEEEEGFKIKIERLREKITSRTKLLILNSPSNPTGAVYHRKELEAIAEIAIEKNIYVISDEIYEKIIYDNLKHISITSLNSEIKKLTLVINGLSKSYSMTGWRIGYAAGPKEIVDAMSRLQSHSTSNPTSFAQKASIVALEGSQEPLRGMVSEFAQRREYIVERLNSITGISCLKPEGAFYVFPNISKLLGKSYKPSPCAQRLGKSQIIKDSINLSQILLEDAKIAVVPGLAFGKDHYLRLSYATSMENITKGMDRLEKFVKKL